VWIEHSAETSTKIVTEKGQRKVSIVASGEKEANITMLCAVSAAGVYIPPMIIFKTEG
jgi:hypothetical protein